VTPFNGRVGASSKRAARGWLLSGIGRGVACALGGPGFEVFDRIDDATAKLAKDRAGAGAAVFFERPA
jgi:hypothetical protein